MTTPTTTTKTVNLSAQLRKLAGANAIEIAVPAGATVRDLLRDLRAAYPDLAATVLDRDDNVTPGIQVLADGRHIDFLQGADTPLDDVAALHLIPPVFGG